MAKCKVAYAKINNAGDLFNEALLDYFGVDYDKGNIMNANLTMLGGMLSALLPSDKLKLRIAQKVLNLLYGDKTPLHVWGTGFLVGSREGKLFRKNLVVHALRGELSRQKLSKLLGQDLQVPLCDPGLMACKFVDKNQVKKYEIGIIPHFKEQDDPLFDMLKCNYENALVIDITKSYTEVLNEIAICKCVISSSLHGLIFADSLGVPNLHIAVSDKLAGDGFKFKDYYSGFGLSDNVFQVKEGVAPSIDYIYNEYRINYCDVEKKVEDMIAAFPKEI